MQQEINKQDTHEEPGKPGDDFLLSQELVGGNPYIFPDVINSRRYVRLLRNLRKSQPIGEGILAAKCGERMFLPEWSVMVTRLVEWGFITLTPVKDVAKAVTVSLTDKGEQWCKHKLDPKPQPEPDTKPGEAFAKEYLRVTGKPLE